MSPARCTASRPRGFTLVEAIATITIMAALGTVVSFMIGGAASGYADARARSELSLALSVTLDHLDREIRNIGLDDAAPGIAPDIDLLQPDRIDFAGNWRIALSGDDLEIVRAGAPAAVLLQGVTSLTIRAFDESNTPLAATLSGAGCEPIRRVSIEITAERGAVAETLRTKVFIRSTMSGAGAGP